VYTISGYVRDAASGENLIGINVFIHSTNKGIATNNYGFYSISISEGNYKITASYPGYEVIDTSIDLKSNIVLNLKIKEKSVQMEEVVIKAKNEKEQITKSEMGLEVLNLKTIENIPLIFGENDVLKVLQLLPGVQSSGEGSSGFNVRGGNYDQNLILLDEAVVYNPGHVFSFISVFNDDAINSLTLYKGSMPASYGGRISSALDITMKEGNNKTFMGKGAIGLISSKITIEGPLVKDESSFIISARRSTIDLLAKPAIKMHGGSLKDDDYYFYDLNAKINHRFSDNDRLYLSAYIGKDAFNFSTGDKRFLMDLPWGNMTADLRWNHLFSNELFMNVSLIDNSFFRDMNLTQDGFQQRKNSKISDQSLKMDLCWYTSFNHRIDIGGQVINHTFTTDNDSKVEKKYGLEYSAFLLDEFDIFNDLHFNLGIRYNEFRQVGPFDEYSYNSNYEPIALIKKYDSYEMVKTYRIFEPRINMRYMINNNSSLKFSYTKNSQFIHLVSNSGSTLPLDIWVPSSKIVKPQLAEQFSLGYSQSFLDDEFSLSIEVYAKNMENLLEFGENFVPSYTNNSEFDYVFGEGKSHGTELTIKKTSGKLQGWLACTFSNTDRTFPDLNDGKTFPSNTDIKLDLNLVATYAIDSKWTLGIDFTLKSGKPFSIPTARFFAMGEMVDQYTTRNNVRLPVYNRLDISAVYKPGNTGGWFDSEWIFAIYNVYNRLNPAFVYFSNEGSVKDNSFVTTPKSVTLLPFMPSVTFKFNFK
jgi:hypothetical protein